MQTKAIVRSADVVVSIRWTAERGAVIRCRLDEASGSTHPVRWMAGSGPLDDQLHAEIDSVVLATLDTALSRTFGQQLHLF